MAEKKKRFVIIDPAPIPFGGVFFSLLREFASRLTIQPAMVSMGIGAGQVEIAYE